MNASFANTAFPASPSAAAGGLLPFSSPATAQPRPQTGGSRIWHFVPYALRQPPPFVGSAVARLGSFSPAARCAAGQGRSEQSSAQRSCVSPSSAAAQRSGASSAELSRSCTAAASSPASAAAKHSQAFAAARRQSFSTVERSCVSPSSAAEPRSGALSFFAAVLFLPVVVLFAAMLGGCESVRQSAPVDGASMQLRTDPAQALPTAVFTQGKNADSPSRYRHRREGIDASGNRFIERTDVRMGTVRDPVITVAEGEPVGEWVVAAIGALSLIAGGVLLYNGWPKVGASLAVGGAIAMVVALTVGDYGWLYAAAILAVGTFAAWTLWSGYKSGLKEGAATPNETASRTFSTVAFAAPASAPVANTTPEPAV